MSRRGRTGKFWVDVELVGLNIARFLEKLAGSCVTIKKLTWVNPRCVKFRLSQADYKLMLAEESSKNYTIRVVEERGVSSLIQAFMRVGGMAFGAIFAFVLFFSCVQCVWSVEVAKDEKHSCTNGERCIFAESNLIELKAYIDALGVSQGARTSSVLSNRSQVERAITSKFDGVASCSIEVVGTRAIVHVFEAVLESAGTQNVFDLVAPQNGIVKKVVVSAGEPRVKAGDMVQKGQVLVKGTSGKKAMASVHMVLIFEKSKVYSEDSLEVVETGEVVEFSHLDVCGVSWGAKNVEMQEYENDSYKKEVTTLNICPNLFVPINKVMIKYKKLKSQLTTTKFSREIEDRIVDKLTSELESAAKLSHTENYKVTSHTSEISSGVFEIDCYLEITRIIKQ